MSVTFRPAFTEADFIGWGFDCYGHHDRFRVSHVLGDRADAFAALEAHAVTCNSCATYGVVTRMDRDDIPEINLANANAGRILSLLGYERDDLCGGADATAMLDRIAFATVVGGGDPGTPDVREGNVIYCGTPDGYTDGVLAHLVEVATWARENGREVHWS